MLTRINDVDLAIETFGDRSDPAILLIAGAGSSMDVWEVPFCERLACGPRFVIRFDQRDTGESTTDEPGQPSYRFTDLVRDLIGILDHAGVEAAHLVGLSMGGAVALLTALEHPARVASLTLMATSTGPGSSLPDMTDSNHPHIPRKKPWRSRLSTLDIPALVIHGELDPLVPLAHGRALAGEIPGARLLAVAGMGHEAPPRQTWGIVVPAILKHTSGGWPSQADRVAARSLAADDPTGWFEQLYASGVAGEVALPWDTDGPRPSLVEWARGRSGTGRRAIVIGSGLGQNSEFIAGLGFDTVAFDISPTAISIVRDRYPDSTVEYLVADLFNPPPQWSQAFDLVVEVFTVQALPIDVRPRAIARVADFAAPGGTLIVIAAARHDADPAPPGPPWPLTRNDIDAFTADGLATVRVEELTDGPGRWWRAEFRRR